MAKLFIKLNQFKDIVLEKCKALFEIEEASVSDSKLIISDDPSVFKEANEAAIKIYVDNKEELTLKNFLETNKNTPINGYYLNGEELAEHLPHECKRIVDTKFDRGLSTITKESIQFEMLFSTKDIGEKIDTICSQNKNLPEALIRNLVSSQLLTTFAFMAKGKFNKVDLEFSYTEDSLLVSSLAPCINCSEKSINDYLAKNPSIVRALMEESQEVSIVFNENLFQITSKISSKADSFAGLVIYSIHGKDENIEGQIQSDKENTSYVNFTKVHEKTKSDKAASNDAKEDEVKFREKQAARQKAAENNNALSDDNTQVPPKEDNIDEEENIDEVAKLDAVGENLESLHSSSKEIVNQNAEMSMQINEILKSSAEDKLKIKELQQIISKQELMSKRFATLSENIERIKDENMSIKTELQEQRRKNIHDINQKAKVEAEVMKLKDDIEKLNSMKQQLASETDKMKNMQAEKDEELRKAAQDIKLNEAEKIKLEKIIDTSEKRVEIARRNEKTAQEKSYEVSREIKELQKKYSALEQKAKRDEGKANNLETQIAAYKQKITQIDTADRSVKAEIQNLKGEINKKDNRITHLSREIGKLKAEMNAKKAEAMAQAQAAKAQAKAQQNTNQDAGPANNQGQASTGSSADLKRMQAQRKQMEEKERQFTRDLQKRDTLISNLKKNAELLDKQLKDSKHAINEMKRRLTIETKQIKDDNKEKDLKIRDLQAEMTKKDNVIKELSAKLTGAKAKEAS